MYCISGACCAKLPARNILLKPLQDAGLTMLMRKLGGMTAICVFKPGSHYAPDTCVPTDKGLSLLLCQKYFEHISV